MSEFFDALGVIVLILDFVMLYRLFYPAVVSSNFIALMLTTLVAFLLLVPYPWLAWVMFAALFMQGFFAQLSEHQW
jgi:hypothetical protein